MKKIISKPLTLSGRYFSKKELLYVQQTVKSFPNLSLTELAETFCEHLNWVTARGRSKLNACLTALEKLEKLGIVSLPRKRRCYVARQLAVLVARYLSREHKAGAPL